ncbi:hypothetical protein [Hymenobacter sp. B81]|uniref:hypothetical protein n=1 Tax=Hymenobacter sp. B81 TaxID=3344878 RepID=UPI0037DC87FD
MAQHNRHRGPDRDDRADFSGHSRRERDDDDHGASASRNAPNSRQRRNEFGGQSDNRPRGYEGDFRGGHGREQEADNFRGGARYYDSVADERSPRYDPRSNYDYDNSRRGYANFGIAGRPGSAARRLDDDDADLLRRRESAAEADRRYQESRGRYGRQRREDEADYRPERGQSGQWMGRSADEPRGGRSYDTRGGQESYASYSDGRGDARRYDENDRDARDHRRSRRDDEDRRYQEPRYDGSNRDGRRSDYGYGNDYSSSLYRDEDRNRTNRYRDEDDRPDYRDSGRRR